MKTSELVKILEENGCYLLINGKKHNVWYSPKTEKQFPVSRHLSQDIPKGAYSNIKNDAGF